MRHRDQRAGRPDRRSGSRPLPGALRRHDLGRPGGRKPGTHRSHGPDRQLALSGGRPDCPRADAGRPRRADPDRRGRRGSAGGALGARGCGRLVTLPPFDLHRPGSVEEATELLDRYGEEAALYCGGTELLLLLKLGFASFGHLVDLKRIEELQGIYSDDGHLVVGAAVTHRELERSQLVLERLPSLAAMERRVANLRVREVGTIGGNLSFSDPHSDPATFLLALDAEVECRRGGEPGRRLPIGEFVLGPYQTALREGELLVSARIPLPDSDTAIAYEKFSFHERPTATVACFARMENGSIVEARVAVGSVGARPTRALEAERLLGGAPPGELDAGVLFQVGDRAAEAAGPVDDANGSADYKAQLVRVLVERALRKATAT
ncbi:MAG: carbon monoxide dehydrogenase [Candidatus Rokuibacteriota bacterium]|nr:MAG: carbon monoxide dehydrogenase [Candidatus Rokubacteria bacterium]